MAYTRSITLIMELHKDQKHHPTPNKAKIKGACEYMDAKGIPYSKRDVFDYFDVKERTGYRMLEGRELRRKY